MADADRPKPPRERTWLDPGPDPQDAPSQTPDGRAGDDQRGDVATPTEDVDYFADVAAVNLP